MTRDALKVLLVEDDEGYSSLVRHLLLMLDPTLFVDAVRNGEEALKAITQYPPSLVLLDLKMPRSSGLSLLQALKQNPVTRRIPVVVLTGYASEDKRYQAYYQHANAFVRKPDTVEELQSLLSALCHFWFRHALLPHPSEIGPDSF